MKTKIVFEEHIIGNHSRYKVVKLTRRLLPNIGAYLTRDEINKLRLGDPDLDYDVIPRKKNG